jgi:PEGA domain/Tetratricopeptide repeat
MGLPFVGTRWRLVFGLMLNVTLMTVSPVTARAADSREPPPLGESLTGDARQAFQRGMTMNANGDYVEAIIAFERGYELSGDPRLFWNLGQCELKLGRYAAAMVWLQRYLAEETDQITIERRLLARRAIEDLRSYTAPVTIRGAPDGADVYINDQLVGHAPLPGPVVVDAGMGRLHVEAIGYTPFNKKIQVVAGQALTTIVTLKKAPAVETAARALPETPSSVSAEAAAPPSPPTEIPSASSPAPGPESRSKPISTPPQARVEDRAELPVATPSRSWLRPTLFATAGATLVAAGLGTYFLVGAHNAQADFVGVTRELKQRKPGATCSDNPRPLECDKFSSLVKRRDGRYTASIVAFGATGALALTSAVLLFLELSQEDGTSSSRSGVTGSWAFRVASVGPAFAGVEVTTRF